MSSPEALSLYFALKSNNLPVKLEFWDGKKTIDIAIPDKLYIEVNEEQDIDADKALTDLLKTFHELKDKIPNIRVSNAQMRNSYQFEIIVDKLTDLCKEFKKTG